VGTRHLDKANTEGPRSALGPRELEGPLPQGPSRETAHVDRLADLVEGFWLDRLALHQHASTVRPTDNLLPGQEEASAARLDLPPTSRTSRWPMRCSLRASREGSWDLLATSRDFLADGMSRGESKIFQAHTIP
jgi:hypothetical protein